MHQFLESHIEIQCFAYNSLRMTQMNLKKIIGPDTYDIDLHAKFENDWVMSNGMVVYAIMGELG